MRSERINHRLLYDHVPMVIVSFVLILFVYFLLDSPDWKFRLSIATGYAAMGFLALTLVVGPWTLMRGRPTPLSTDFRRDLGYWSAILGLLHVVFGIQVHMGNIWLYFFSGSRERVEWIPRSDLFGWTNHLGLLATLVLLMLAGLSNDAAMRWLGGRAWKNFQRASYFLFALLLGHGVIYQVLEKRKPGWVALFAALAIPAIAFQFAGLRRFRSRLSRRD